MGGHSNEAKRTALLRIAFVVTLLAVFALALAPAPEDLKLFSWQDKVEHVVLFTGLCLLGIAAWPDRVSLVAMGLLAYGLAMEVAQSFTAHRYGDAGDWLADALGVVLALLLNMLWRRTEVR